MYLNESFFVAVPDYQNGFRECRAETKVCDKEAHVASTVMGRIGSLAANIFVLHLGRLVDAKSTCYCFD